MGSVATEASAHDTLGRIREEHQKAYLQVQASQQLGKLHTPRSHLPGAGSPPDPEEMDSGSETSSCTRQHLGPYLARSS